VKVACTQCGARHAVIDSDFFLSCPFCSARMVVNPPAHAPVMVAPAVDPGEASRLFPPGVASSVALRYFPYLEEEGLPLRPCFSQPWSELDRYVPPAGDRRMFDESSAEPGQLIPFDRERVDEGSGRIIFHPFFVVMLALDGYSEGVLVDGVSGRLLGPSPTAGSTGRSRSLRRLFLLALAAGLAAAAPVFLLVKAVGAGRSPAALAALLASALAVRFAAGLADRRADGDE